MDTIKKDSIAPLENEAAILDLSDDRIKLLERRGFFPTSSGMIDDTYYTTREQLEDWTHLKGKRAVQELIDMPVAEMEKVLFMKDSMIPIPVIFLFDEALIVRSFGYKRFYDADPLTLDPFIARYVRVINRCGIKTFYSCDGWHNDPHKSFEMVIIFSDRYSYLWHRALCKLFDVSKIFRWEHAHKGTQCWARIRLSRDDGEKMQMYKHVLHVADMFYENLDLLKELKDLFLQDDDRWDIDDLSDTPAVWKMYDYLEKHFRQNKA